MNLTEARDFIHSLKSSNINVSLDECQTVFFGTHPITHKFFVAEDFDFPYYVDVPRHLAPLLEMKEVVPVGDYYRGEIIFSGNIDFDIHENKKYYTVYKDALVYGVEADSSLGEKWKNSKLGIAVREQYRKNSSLRYVDYDSFTESENVWIADLKVTLNTSFDVNEKLNSIQMDEAAESRLLEISDLIVKSCDIDKFPLKKFKQTTTGLSRVKYSCFTTENERFKLEEIGDKHGN